MNPLVAAAFWTLGLLLAIASIGIYVWAVDFMPRESSRGTRLASLGFMALALCSFHFGGTGRLF